MHWYNGDKSMNLFGYYVTVYKMMGSGLEERPIGVERAFTFWDSIKKIGPPYLELAFLCVWFCASSYIPRVMAAI